MTTYSFAAITNGTDLGAVSGFTRESGVSGAVIVNASHNLDFASTTETHYSLTEGTVNHSLQLVLASGSGSGGNFYPLCVRWSDVNNYIMARITSANNLELYKKSAGTTSGILGTYALTGRAIGDKVRIECNGNTINVYYTPVATGIEVLRITITESFNNTATKMALIARSSTTTSFASSIIAISVVTASVVSVNAGGGLKAGASNVPFVVTAFTPTSANIGGLSLTSIAGTTPNMTGSVPSYADGDTRPGFGNQTFTASDGASSPTLSNVPNLPSGNYDYVTLAGTLDQTSNGILYNLSPAAVVGDQIAFDGTITIVNPNGAALTAYTGTQTLWHWKASTGVIRSYPLTTGDSPSSSNRKGRICIGLGLGLSL